MKRERPLKINMPFEDALRVALNTPLPAERSSKRKSSQHYLFGKCPITKKSKALHRIVMEKHLGRFLDRGEVVHHKNGKKHDNRLENLMIVTHANHHGEVKCVHCEKTFLIH